MTYKKSYMAALSALGLSSSPFTIQAEDNPSYNYALPQIIVTATRTANTVDETIAPVTIFTKEDIQRSQASSLIDVLRTAPGVSFTRNAGFGSNEGISIRGSNTDHVLYLIDGVPIRSATTGTAAIQYIPIGQVERIEIVRGPRSSIYGSDAIGGVIQIFTQQGVQNTVSASVGYGSDNTKEVTANYSTGDELSHMNVGVSLFDTDGYDFYGYAFDPVTYQTKPNAIDEDDDGYHNYSISVNAAHKISDQLRISGTFLRSQGENQYDGYFNKNTHSDFTEQLLSGNIDFDVTQQWNTKLKISRNYDKQYNELDAVSDKTKFNTKTDTVNWQNDIIVRETDILTLGLDYKNDKVDSSTDYAEDSRWNHAAFAQYQYDGNVFTSQLSMRYDDNEAFGSHNTWSFATGFSLDENVRVTTSYGTAFKAPTFNDLYYPNFWGYSGNPDLKPEESESFDFGLEITTGKILWTAHYFTTHVDNLIASNATFSTVENIAKAEINGFELTLDTNLSGYQISANASFIDPTDEKTGLLLARRSKRNLNLSIDKNFGALSYGASLIASSERYNQPGEVEQLSGFGLFNIRTAWQLNKQWTVKAKVDNLFDKEYVLTKDFDGNDYKQPDRFVFASIHYKM